MQELRRMKFIETMERITRQKFCDYFDEILDRVDKEDIGFVILDSRNRANGNSGNFMRISAAPGTESSRPPESWKTKKCMTETEFDK